MSPTLIKLGIGTLHNEICTPDNKEFIDFFQVFKRIPIERVDVQYTKEGLANIDALFIGASRKPFNESEVEAIKEWTENGGRLMLVSSMGGDKAVQCFSYNQTNLGEIAPEVEFTDTTMGCNIYSEAHRQYGFHSQCTIDVSHRTPQEPRMTYVDGCEICVRSPADGVVEKKLFFAGGTKEVSGLRQDRPRHHHYPRNHSGHPLVIVKRGKGRVLCFGAVDTFSRKGLKEKGNPAFAVDVLFDWLDTLVDVELKNRMESPQRHRFL
jgi:hypothetical protein